MPTVNAVDSNETIHDFGGVPRALYDLRFNFRCNRISDLSTIFLSDALWRR